jgi:hypothetical protein
MIDYLFADLTDYRPIFYGELVEPGPKGHSFR